MHGWTHRPASQGGTDPVPFSPTIPWVQRARTSTVDVAADTDAYIDWATYSDHGGTDYFADYTDGNGVKGIKILDTGLYVFTANVLVTENNGTDVIPPTLATLIATGLDGTNNFGTSALVLSATEGWMRNNPAGAYVAPNFSPVSKSQRLGGTFIYPFTSSDLSSYDTFTCRIVSKNSTAAWRYSVSLLTIARIGDLAT